MNKEIDDLSKEINKLNIRLKELQKNAVRTGQKRKRTVPLKIGDRVVVTNNYKNRSGIKGTIVQLTKTQAYVLPDNGVVTFRSYKQNLRLLR